MYLASVISGPKQPSLDNLNHYMQPLINDMVDAWDWVVCDLPTTRHLACLVHWICSTCNCYHKSSYFFMTEYKEYGVHYSELWHLLYWNPAHQLIVDPMQCILEGLVKHHIWNLLELAAENPNVPEQPASHEAFDYR
ncbi:hypothetical protein V8E55_005711 [Tylopilus felleus]